MGWASATGIVIDVWNAVRERVPEQERPAILAKMMEPFFDGDWDCEDEVIGVWPEAHAALCIAEPQFHELYDDCGRKDDALFEDAVHKALAGETHGQPTESWEFDCTVRGDVHATGREDARSKIIDWLYEGRVTHYVDVNLHYLERQR